MKIIADTSIWIEFLKFNKNIFFTFREKLENQEIIAVECVFGELLQGAKTNNEQKVITSYWDCLPKLNETGVWVKAGSYSSENNLIEKGIGLIDCVILILAIENNLRVWTLDKKLSMVLGKSFIYK